MAVNSAAPRFTKLMRSSVTCAAAVLSIFAVSLSAQVASPNAPMQFERDIRPFLHQYCARCHNTSTASAGINLERLNSVVALQQHRERVEEVIHALESGVMPLKGQPQPSDSLRSEVVAGLRSELDHFDFASHKNPGNLPLHRLTRTQYRNTIRDLVGVGEEVSEDLPADESTFGFDHIADVQDISPAHMERYLSAAKYVLDRVFLPPPKTWTFEAGKLSYVREFGLSGGDEKVKLPDEIPAHEVHGAEHVFLRAGGVVFAHSFPQSGLYRMRLKAWSVKAQNARGGPSLKIKIDSDEVASVRPVSQGSQTGSVTAQFVVRSGRHDVKIEMEGMGYAEQASDPALRISKVGVELIEIIGPVPADEARHAKVLADLLVAAPGVQPGVQPGVRPRQAARLVLERFVPLAFRRPARPEEVEGVAALFDRASARGRSYEDSIRVSLQAVLTSPNFLFHVSDERDTTEPYRVNDYDLASRLSYFLWASMPDAELFELARQDRLHDPVVLHGQTSRMLKDARSKSLAEKFAPQWLALGSLFAVHRDEPFHENNLSLRQMLLDEVVMFFDSIVREDHSIFDLLDANYTFVNERLAKHYGIQGVTGPQTRRVELTGAVREQRGGVLTMAGVLLAMSHPANTNPSGRGRWVLDSLLGTPPPPPPPSVKPLAIPKKDEVVDTQRDRLTLHRSDPACAGCHAKIDPIGFALENYDQVGAWRTSDRGKPIDATGQLPQGAAFHGPVELKKLLATDKRSLFIRNFVRKMLTYSLRRGLEYYDEVPIRDAEAALAANDYRMSALIQSIVGSYPFQYRQNPPSQEMAQ